MCFVGLMGFNEAFHATAGFASPPDLDGFRRHLDPAWIEQALEATGTATVRRRRLPSEQVIWVVLGMGLFRDRPMEDIVSKLDLALPGVGTVARSSVSQARERVGDGGTRRSGKNRPNSHQLHRVASTNPQRVGLALGHKPRRHSQKACSSAPEREALHLASTSQENLSASRQDQDQPIRPQAASLSERHCQYYLIRSSTPPLLRSSAPPLLRCVARRASVELPLLLSPRAASRHRGVTPHRAIAGGVW